MRIQHQTLAAPGLRTIAWAGPEALIDWACAGQRYVLDGQRSQVGESHFVAGFDRAITSADGQYAFIYQSLGTKGLLLRDGELLREINRSYYHSDVYEYSAAFATVDATTYLVHCPVAYCQLDLEHVETGELVTNVAGREPIDCFHSRLEVSPAGGYLLSKGWLWHQARRGEEWRPNRGAFRGIGCRAIGPLLVLLQEPRCRLRGRWPAASPLRPAARLNVQ